MSKQKIILIISSLILISAVLFGYVFIKQQEVKVEDIPKTEIELKNEEILKELQSFKKPTTEIQIPKSEATVDYTIKSDEEIKKELDSYKPSKDSNKKSDEEILKLLTDPNI